MRPKALWLHYADDSASSAVCIPTDSKAPWQCMPLLCCICRAFPLPLLLLLLLLLLLRNIPV
jgi:hypothetical protein